MTVDQLSVDSIVVTESRVIARGRWTEIKDRLDAARSTLTQLEITDQRKNAESSPASRTPRPYR